ncbi:hypothetical protein VST7929_02413 [Vibrio stylophorae]|uniref:MSHA biogenesis protein MshJ n=1 Tax=Vibrio stylophorae TaxID=659351 RepID=A0ABN8DX80_9VIBR|nr:hypothetical protein [Vibrio stylophorae]CAH0534480.1 hypothetical protein VST7929_02413 [Vibrio stylophorae]
MMSFLQKLSEQFAERSPRERVLIAVLLQVLLIVLFMMLWLDPQMDQKIGAQRQLEAVKSEQQQLQLTIDALDQALAKDPDQQVRKDIQQLDVQLVRLNRELENSMGALLSPQQMAPLLETMMKESHQLRLLSIRSMQPQPITDVSQETAQASNTSTDEAKNSDSVPTEQPIQPSVRAMTLYQHPVKIEFTGRYFDIANYLLKLEQMPQRFYWQSLDYQVSDFPRAKVVLQIYTLGQREAFIGG